jgi:ankyrin repeat protein
MMGLAYSESSSTHLNLLQVPTQEASSMLQDAIKGCNLDDIKGAVAQGASVNSIFTINDNQESALIYSMHCAELTIPAYFINKGANVNFQDSNGSNALMALIANGRSDGTWEVPLAEMLINHGIDLNARDNDGSNALMALTANGRSEAPWIRILAEMLITHGIHLNARNHNGMSAIMFAAESENNDITMVLLQHHVNLSYATTHGDFEPIGSTALLIASSKADYEILIPWLLIQQGAVLETRDENGHTPLYYAVQAQSYSITDDLLRHGAQVDSQTLQLAYSLAYDDPYNRDILQLVLKYTNNQILNMRDQNGDTPLYYAVQDQSYTITDDLLRHGAQVDCQTFQLADDLARNDPDNQPILQLVLKYRTTQELNHCKSESQSIDHRKREGRS